MAAFATDRGRLRSNNEDAVAVDRDAGIFIVCDGMGGAAAGEIASRHTADNVLASLQRYPSIALVTAIRSANEELFTSASAQSDRWGMGTTIVALRLAGEAAVVANVGDSRCYRLRQNVLEQMTRDHSFVAEQMRRGLMTDEEASTSPMKNVITRAIGTNENVEIDMAEWQVKNGDVYLLASDGLTREVSDAEIAAILQEMKSPEAGCSALIAAANNAGGRDNITCVVVRIASEGSMIHSTDISGTAADF